MGMAVKRIASGLAWIAFSPFALLMAVGAGAKATSDAEFGTYLVVCGAWTVAGVVAGIGTIASAEWAGRLKTILLWIVATYFGGSGLIFAWYMAASEPGVVDRVLALVTALIATGIAASVVLWTRHRKRRDARLYIPQADQIEQVDHRR